MNRAILISLAAATLASPAVADELHIYVDRDRDHAPIAPNNESNKWWVDYKTDISEAKRELASDLRRATDLEDRIDAREPNIAVRSPMRATIIARKWPSAAFAWSISERTGAFGRCASRALLSRAIRL